MRIQRVRGSAVVTRSRATLTCLLVLLVGATACSPLAPGPLVGIQVTETSLSLLVHRCSDWSVESLELGTGLDPEGEVLARVEAPKLDESQPVARYSLTGLVPPLVEPSSSELEAFFVVVQTSAGVLPAAFKGRPPPGEVMYRKEDGEPLTTGSPAEFSRDSRDACESAA